VRDHLRELGADLAAAATSADHDDWAVVLQAVRQIQGRAVVTRSLLEHMLGQDAAASEPPLVRVVREIGPLISDRELDSLPPDELRARMGRVQHALSRELQAMLSPLDEPSIPSKLDDHRSSRPSPQPRQRYDHHADYHRHGHDGGQQHGDGRPGLRVSADR